MVRNRTSAAYGKLTDLSILDPVLHQASKFRLFGLQNENMNRNDRHWIKQNGAQNPLVFRISSICYWGHPTVRSDQSHLFGKYCSPHKF